MRDLFDQAERQDRPVAAAAVAGRRALVTGAGGSIGRALVRALAAGGAAHLVLLDASEQALYEVDREMAGVSRSSLLGSAGDAGLCAELLEQHRPQVVFHAAAFKHVPLLESNPFAAITNNVFGTEALVRVAMESRVEDFVLVSTDKAVEPHSIMGASKRIAELILMANAGGRTRMSAVRLGNVWRSQGSVVELFSEQIAAGGPVTITHPDVRRFFISMDAAVDAIMTALQARRSGVVRAPDVGDAVRVLDVAEELIERDGRGTPIVFTELRAGDKMVESMISARERWMDDEGGALRGIESPSLTTALLHAGLDELRRSIKLRDADGLIAAVRELVPEYVPSAVIQAALNHPAGVTV